jgi:transposase
MKKGYQKLVLTPGKNERINAFITLLWPIKAIKYNIFKARNSKLFKRHLTELLRLIHKKGFKKLILFLDNASYHKAIKEFIKSHSHDLKLFYLPRHAPELNEVEGNRPLKAGIGSNHAYKSLEELEKDAFIYLRRLNSLWQKQRDLT